VGTTDLPVLLSSSIKSPDGGRKHAGYRKGSNFNIRRIEMKSSRWSQAVLVVALGSAALLNGQTPRPQTSAPDNTKTNKTDTAKPTADDQKQNKSDVQITQQIRKLVTDDKGLSTYAKNVKIISQNGSVTLSGPVRSEEEKKSIEAKAAQVAGTSNVKSELQIAADKPAKAKK
jgi:hyperosmotically inducible protein